MDSADSNRSASLAPLLLRTFRRDRWLLLLFPLVHIIFPTCVEAFAPSFVDHTSNKSKSNIMAATRRSYVQRSTCQILALLTLFPSVSHSFSIQNPVVVSLSSKPGLPLTTQVQPNKTPVAYKAISLPIPDFPGTTVPVACWFPLSDPSVANAAPPTSYPHRISMRRIGQLLPNWDFIPAFVAKDFLLPPTHASVVDGRGMPLLSSGPRPLVVLAHGFLGSRFDLSHLAEDLASAGYVCISAEYPESLAASYERQEGLDRRLVNRHLLSYLQNTLGEGSISSYGVIGHSLGCGTVEDIGDDSWTRVSIAGFPRASNTSRRGLQIASLNDSLVRMRNGSAADYTVASYALIDPEQQQEGEIPHRAAWVLDRPDAPNHISFLSEGVNDAMIEFLSPLLPVAKALNIPVLDFDRYQESRDSQATARAVFPVIRQYLQQEMKQ